MHQLEAERERLAREIREQEAVEGNQQRQYCCCMFRFYMCPKEVLLLHHLLAAYPLNAVTADSCVTVVRVIQPQGENNATVRASNGPGDVRRRQAAQQWVNMRYVNSQNVG